MHSRLPVKLYILSHSASGIYIQYIPLASQLSSSHRSASKANHTHVQYTACLTVLYTTAEGHGTISIPWITRPTMSSVYNTVCTECGITAEDLANGASFARSRQAYIFHGLHQLEKTIQDPQVTVLNADDVAKLWGGGPCSASHEEYYDTCRKVINTLSSHTHILSQKLCDVLEDECKDVKTKCAIFNSYFSHRPTEQVPLALQLGLAKLSEDDRWKATAMVIEDMTMGLLSIDSKPLLAERWGKRVFYVLYFPLFVIVLEVR